MKIRNEVKVGILGVISISLLVWGYSFLRGKNILSNDIVIYAEFDDVYGLNVSAPVTIQGFKVGTVTNITLQNTTLKGSRGQDSTATIALVEMRIGKGTKIPKGENTYAEIVSPSMLSGKEIALRYVGACDGETCLQGDEKIGGRVAGMLDGIMESAAPLLDNLGEKAQPLLDGFDKLNEPNGAVQDLGQVVDNVRLITEQVNQLLVTTSANLNATMANLNAITGNLKNSNEDITGLIGNVNGITEQIQEADLGKTLKDVSGTVSNLNETITGAQTTLQNVNGALENITDLTDFENKDGVLPMLLNDGDFTETVELTMTDLRLLLQDIRLHPERYRTVLSRKQKAYEHTPVEDDPGHTN